MTCVTMTFVMLKEDLPFKFSSSWKVNLLIKKWPEKLIRLLDQAQLVPALRLKDILWWSVVCVHLRAGPFWGCLLLLHRLLRLERPARLCCFLFLFQFHVRLTTLLNLVESVARLWRKGCWSLTDMTFCSDYHGLFCFDFAWFASLRAPAGPLSRPRADTRLRVPSAFVTLMAWETSFLLNLYQWGQW